jgi:hypothetical protein
VALALSQFIDRFTIKGGGSPVLDEAAGARDLSLTGTGTAPRANSYKRRRGAEFRSSSFSATSPRAFASATATGLNTALIVSSKIQSHTWYQWVKPQKTGLSAVALTPLGGLFSATNVGATAWVYDQPILLLTDGAAGSGYVVVSVLGSILDTRFATQLTGPTTTTPLEDGDYSFCAVVVTGSSTVNHQVDAVRLYVRNSDGVVRTYSLGERKASARSNFTTNPSDGDTYTIQGRAYTWKTALAGTPAGSTWTYGAGNALDGETVTIGEDSTGAPIVYTFRDYVGAGLAAMMRFEFGVSVGYSGSTPKTRMSVGGWDVTMLWGTVNPPLSAGAGSMGAGTVAADYGAQEAAVVFNVWHGDYDGKPNLLLPAPPATGYDAGRQWADRRVVPGTSSTLLSATDASKQIPLRALAVGIPTVAVMCWEQTAATGAWDLPCTPARLGRNSPFVIRVRATTTDVIAAANAGAGNVADGAYKYTCTFVNAAGESVEQNPTSHTVTGGPRAVSLSTIPLGPVGTTARKVYRTKAGGSTYYLLTTISDNTTATYSDTTVDGSLSATTLPTTMYMTGGAAAAGSKSVKIGATWADTLANLVKAINATGTPGTEYSADITTANPSATASASVNDLVLVSKYAGTAGNGKPAASTCVALPATAFTGGVDGATADQVLIGASAQASYQNFVDAVNLTGAPGLAYGDPTTINLHVAGTIATGYVIWRSLESGATGTGRTLASTNTGVTIKDEWNDKTLTALYGGRAAPPFTVPSGSRPDQTDLRLLVGGWPS